MPKALGFPRRQPWRTPCRARTLCGSFYTVELVSGGGELAQRREVLGVDWSELGLLRKLKRLPVLRAAQGPVYALDDAGELANRGRANAVDDCGEGGAHGGFP